MKLLPAMYTVRLTGRLTVDRPVVKAASVARWTVNPFSLLELSFHVRVIRSVVVPYLAAVAEKADGAAGPGAVTATLAVLE
jgi:hypothetical protein